MNDFYNYINNCKFIDQCKLLKEGDGNNLTNSRRFSQFSIGK